MNGEVKKETDKAEELFYKTALNTKFQQDLRVYRKKFDMPENGFQSKEDVENWLKTMEKSKDLKKYPLGYVQEQVNILKKYRLPLTLHTLLEEYIWTNNKFKAYPRTPYFGCDIELPWLPDSKEEMWRKSGQPFVKLLIFGGATQRDVLRYIQKSWGFINKLLNEQAGKPIKRIRKTTEKKRDELIFQLSKMPKQELEKRLGEKAFYKEMAIRKLLLRDYGIEVNSDHIKQIVAHQRKLRK